MNKLTKDEMMFRTAVLKGFLKYSRHSKVERFFVFLDLLPAVRAKGIDCFIHPSFALHLAQNDEVFLAYRCLGHVVDGTRRYRMWRRFDKRQRLRD